MFYDFLSQKMVGKVLQDGKLTQMNWKQLLAQEPKQLFLIHQIILLERYIFVCTFYIIQTLNTKYRDQNIVNCSQFGREFHFRKVRFLFRSKAYAVVVEELTFSFRLPGSMFKKYSFNFCILHTEFWISTRVMTSSKVRLVRVMTVL